MNKWIPLTEDLPDIDHDFDGPYDRHVEVLVTDGKMIHIASLIYHKEGANWFARNKHHALRGISHWMPLPKIELNNKPTATCLRCHAEIEWLEDGPPPEAGVMCPACPDLGVTKGVLYFK